VKDATDVLLNFLANATQYVRVDLYTLTLNGGGALRWSSSSIPITAKVGGVTNTWNVGPPIQDGGVQSTRGAGGASVDLKIFGGAPGGYTIGGEDVLDWIDGLGLAGATLRIDRGFAASWRQMLATGPVGTFCRGQFLLPEIKDLGVTEATVAFKSPLALLNQTFPFEMYQLSCLNVFGDANCGVDVTALTVSGVVSTAGVSSTETLFGSNLTQADAYFSLGVVTFTSGANQGVARTVKTYLNAEGQVTVSAPFPNPPANGDAFTISPGCSLAFSSTNPNGCTQWQGSAEEADLRYRGFLFVPPPYTGLPT